MYKKEKEYFEIVETIINGNRIHAKKKILSWSKLEIVGLFGFIEFEECNGLNYSSRELINLLS